MLDDLFVADNLRTLQDAAMRPPPVPKQAASFSAWRTTTALPRGVVAGGVQAGSGMADVLGAFGETLGATGTASSRGMFSVPTADERQQADAAAKKLREQGASFDLGDPGRRFADEFKPDPETAHTAERLVFDFARVATKAVGYVASSGGLPGALMTGADEGLTVADELKQQGVDLATRTKVGAVVGGVTALGVGLPMAGNTLAQTAGLVALGGPVSFMAQQQAVRSILEAADYTKLAEQYDPLDPVGLAVSTLIPAGFGAWGLRAARARQARDASAAAAKAEADFASGPVPSERTAVADAVRVATDEQVDAARVMLAVERRQAGNPGRAEDLQAQQAHETALGRAEEQMARGERVAVADVAPRVESVGPVAIPAEITRVPVQIVKRKGFDAVDVAKTEATMPPVADGFVRLYRGESPTVKFSDVFDVAQLTGERAPQIPGARYTPDLKYADYYRSSYGKDATVHYIDVPQAVADAGKVSDYEYKIDVGAVNAARRLTTNLRAANFEAWFGGSKVVDEAGKPLVVYHGTPNEFASFKAGRHGLIFVSPDPQFAARYAGEEFTVEVVGGSPNVLPLYVKAANPFDGTNPEHVAKVAPMLKDPDAEARLSSGMWELLEEDNIVAAIKSAGFDAMAVTEQGVKNLAVFEPSQLKSATGNSGRFDPNSASLTDSPIADWTANVNAAIRELRAAAKELEPNAATPARATPETAPPAADAPPADARGPGPEQQPAGPDAAARGPATAEARLVDDATARQADALLAEQPDMLVMLDGMDAPRRLSEVLADIKAEADEMRLDGELLQVAAQCALQHGA